MTLSTELQLGPGAVLRFAPSPNGALHLGHALSALLNFDIARRSGGRFLLRIEDIDLGRRRQSHVDGIFRDLAWLGIDWPEPVLMQSLRFDAYRQAADALVALGLLYPCFATRAEIIAAADPAKCDPDGAPLYPGLHKQMSANEVATRKAAGEPFALRIDMEKACEAMRCVKGNSDLAYTALDETGRETEVQARPERWGDAVILRKDVPASYHLAVVVDDAFQGITHVVRGEDLRAATDLHRLLQVLLDLPAPTYHHHGLILDRDDRKLSKSRGAESIQTLRESGATPSDVRELIGLPPALHP